MARKKIEKTAINSAETNPALLPEPTPFRKTQYIPLGFHYLDNTLLRGGIPMNGITELYGAEQAGKTLVAMRIIAQAQRLYPDKVAVWIDTENRFDPEWAERHGIDLSPDKFRLYATGAIEKASETLLQSMASNIVSVVVIDSIANTDNETSLGYNAFGKDAKANVGGYAKAITKLVKAICNYQNQIDTAVVLTNQIRDKIGVLFGSPEDRPGGKALKHDVILRIRLSKVEDVLNSSKTEILGHKVSFSVKKNSKKGIPVQATTDDNSHPVFYLDNGIEKGAVVEMVDVATDLGLFIKAGAWIKWVDENDIEVEKFQGKDKLINAFMESIDMQNTLLNMIKNVKSTKPEKEQTKVYFEEEEVDSEEEIDD